MASTPLSSRGRDSARSDRSRTGSLPAPALFIGGAAVVVVIVFLVLNNRGGSQPANAGQTPAAAPTAAKAVAPAAPASEKVQPAVAKAGKTPSTPPPALTEATLQQLGDLLGRVKVLRNEAVTARTSNADNQGARAKMSEAKTLLEQWKNLVAAPLRWQEDAQLSDWAQPAEYVALEALYVTYQRLDNEVRKGGG